MVTAGNVFLASIPFALPVVELNRPDSETAPKSAPAVNVLDSAMLVTACVKPVGGVSPSLLVPFVQVLLVAMAHMPPAAVVSAPSITSVSFGITAPVPMAITSHAPVNAPLHPLKASVELT